MTAEQLSKVFETAKFEQYAYNTELYAAKTLEKFYSYKFIVYGAGDNARAVINYLVRTQGMQIECIIDKSSEKTEVEGVPVISREEFSEMNGEEKRNRWCALVSVGLYGIHDGVTKDIDKYLYSEGTIKIIKVDPQITTITKSDWYDFFFNHRETLCKNIELFVDDISKQTYYEFIRSYLEGHRYQGKTSREEDKYFLLEEDIIKRLKDERWINLGAYNGDTIYHFINSGLSFKQIFAVEGDVDTAKNLEKNISMLPDELNKKIKIINEYFGGEGNSTLDGYFANERITYINMDIEGAEAEVLKSAETIVKTNRPVLAICVYHRKDDLIVIPKLLSEMVDNYTYFLRKYPSQIGGYFNGYFELNELVFYAVPNERLY